MLTSALTLCENRQKSQHRGTDTVFYGERYGRSLTKSRNNRFDSSRRKGSRRSPSELVAIKARTKCLRCGRVGNWKDECPDRSQSMTEIIRSRIREKGGKDRAAAEILFTIATDDDDYKEFIQTTGPELHGKHTQDNNFEVMLAEEVGTEDAAVDSCEKKARHRSPSMEKKATLLYSSGKCSRSLAVNPKRACVCPQPCFSF